MPETAAGRALRKLFQVCHQWSLMRSLQMFMPGSLAWAKTISQRIRGANGQAKKKNEYEGLSGKPRTVKHDKHGNPIYPKKSPGEEYLIVDGYNIIFAWEDLKELSRINIDSARDALKDVLSDYQGYKGCHLLLVFDAYKVKGNAGKRETFHNIEVVYTKQDETADAFIEKTVFGIRDRYKVTVATSDGLEQQTVMSLGALRMSARELKEHIEMTKRAGMEAFISG